MVCLFCLLVSPRLFLYVIVLCTFACVERSARNKDNKPQGVSSFFRNYSEKDKGNVMGKTVAATQSGGGRATAVVNLAVIRRQWKAAIMRHLDSLSRRPAEGNTELIWERLIELQAPFCKLGQISDAHLATLADKGDFDESETWFAETEGRYIAGVKSAHKWLHKNEQPNSGNHGNTSSDPGATSLVDIILM